MDWEFEGLSGQWSGDFGQYWIGDHGSKLAPHVLSFVHPGNFDIELGRYVNLTAAKEAAETHAGVTA